MLSSSLLFYNKFYIHPNQIYDENNKILPTKEIVSAINTSNTLIRLLVL